MNRQNIWLAACALGLGIAGNPALAATAQNSVASPAPDIRRDATVQAIEKVMASVVNLATETIVEYHDPYEELFRRFYGAPGVPRRERFLDLGSGVIIDEEGYVLTNFHVVRRASRIQVKLWDGREYDAVALVVSEGTDVALLKIKAKPGEKFVPIRFAQDDDLLLGETVLALGNPFGLGSAVTKGILSSKNRRPPMANQPLDVEDWLQTDAAINPGNSGGPLVNLRGELIGLNVAVSDDSRGMGMGFSIPVKQVSAALAQFFSPEVTHSLWFGARVRGGNGPLTVMQVQPDSPAAKGGLKDGDLITEVNGERPGSLIAFNRLLGASQAKPVRLSIERGGQAQKLSVTMVSFEDMVRQRLGLKLLQPTPETAKQLGINPGQGLFIAEVEEGSPAAKAGLQDGHFLLAIDSQAAREFRSLGEIISSKKPGERVRLDIGVPLVYQNGLRGVRRAAADVALR